MRPAVLWHLSVWFWVCSMCSGSTVSIMVLGVFDVHCINYGFGCVRYAAQRFYTRWLGLFEDATEPDAVLEILPHMYNKDDVLSSHRISEFW